ncbi:dephospho-CoA kinase [Allobacillus sp. GCM10007491]|uniref:Dephospho-CoA kinase n=1 Tax=Allobacillus saliphilus TaxID=2912308 RepID=A0A941CUL2_9BACI|nr:dephospho-CoA kinase [Allobacillus saliphilus]MBR7554252.1 dephospho-CoA kinase [Allobacillus saliphilus]
MTLVVGLTGSIATGKSTISNMFKVAEIPVIDADAIARDVVEPGEPAFEKIKAHFGDEVIGTDGTLDRKRLGNIVFNDEQKRTELNQIIHPEIRKEMLTQRDKLIKQDVPLVVMDIPLLFESKLFDYVDRTLVVYIPEELQLERLMDRDGSTREEAKSRIDAQISIEKKKNQADAIINNSGTVDESKQQLRDILTNWNVPNLLKN